ncbi:FAD-binding and (Fe-S)-binding domain-containing protein [Colwellia piezophila]|uniref:FAD-binding and (Fe-S)-binding domain-containing protein n=1 Tax=Colwellia piezophila TaxID=211668 RepID=UPI000380B67B|nr:FAD-binding and (Fe-S)-binding domain-containing protein [Colwellia piezophila]
MPANLFADFFNKLSLFLSPDEIITSYTKRYAFGTDASFYRLVPKLILQLKNKEQLKEVLQLASTHQVPVTFRAAGTSLSGQAITDSVLITLSNDWQAFEIHDLGKKITLQPGIIGAKANQLLKPYQKKIGPDPASIDSCKIGGIAANNASGMCCGVKQNSYHTLSDMTIIFADGSELNTADKLSCAAFLKHKTIMVEQINKLLKQVKQDPELSELIEHKYRLKNTCGYGLNALIDFEHPIDVIKHLIIGSEGTLGFIADITYHTVDDHPYKFTGFYVFEELSTACNLVTKLANLDVTAVELLDYRALKSVADHPLMHACIPNLTENSAALLIELQAADQTQLAKIKQAVEQQLHPIEQLINYQVVFTDKAEISSQLWQIRKGTFPAVGAVRETGTTVIIEDVAFPIEKLAEGVNELQRLFVKYDYIEAIIFGHALDGNLHFVFTQSFNEQREIDRYSAFMEEVAQLVAVRFKGSLKAEHGTGRNMAPYVKLEWGDKAYALMQDIKKIFDPNNILNPGVILNDNPHVHLENLKTLPAANTIIDKCIECGFCETVCPSNGYTLTPRQRITVWRRITELALAINNSEQDVPAHEAEYQLLLQDYQHMGIDSCAATGLCGLKCPVGINTGEFIKALRAEKLDTQPIAKKIAQITANNIGTVLTAAKLGMSAISAVNGIFSAPVVESGFKMLNKISAKRIPLYYPAWPKGAKALLKTQQKFSILDNTKKVIYLPSCGGRVFAQDTNAKDQRDLNQVILAILAKAGFEAIIPTGASQLCCGMPWSSKGDQQTADQKSKQLIEHILPFTEQGSIPVIMDASPCALTLNQFDNQQVIYESVEFIAQFALDKLTITAQAEPITVHITCSSKRQKTENSLLTIAHACSEEVIVPSDIHCCGFAGDKGFVLPELNENALKSLKQQVSGECSEGFSTSRTCEIGLSKATDIPYQSIVYLLDRVSH